ncbi:bifunctional cobalt-precorrin-7 (C(5))-methyltransferase/cobalt-precorrin-6B (C(15))-methyltransferase [Natranaerobius thermophilus]|uniref:Precorrin-6Y C5,15-methyltransferase (Decarboxylating), CbiT subunit n=1 Tax=Natranaerobius thermophilus (strain ATCC BAA-1301 / DSM 18059 / JW/NM-WN-LF) TaxID=457570 RepID=B2A0F5_NATTJ|nr:bifunctional cobalt-precorrin-7 (C(5))-methyltransferase/cobalt-precorrin-6B (C(15))-methyltransferase [Natranaerobius thermophilus]ACB84516.1 precorrin-6Y C5,15-methyltransferase (decarboxylating), CbiT subunit [Natranaerobius thermophilus JW/NM-WN-LF]
MGKIIIVGIGPGSKSYLTEQGKNYILNASILVGSQPALKLSRVLGAQPNKTYDYSLGMDSILAKIDSCLQEDRTVTVLVSGDPGYYSLCSLIKNKFSQDKIKIVPGISSLQLGLSKIQENWNDVDSISLHGRKNNLENCLLLMKSCDKLAILLGGDVDTHLFGEYICLNDSNFKKRKVTVLANLSWDSEQVFETTIEQLSNYPPYENCILFTNRESGEAGDCNSTKVSFSDKEIIKRNVPRTKEEIRAVLVSKMNLYRGAVVWDIGAGTGAISLECSSMVGPQGKVCAVERSTEALEVIKENKSKFQRNNIEIVAGEAPGVLGELPPPDRVIVGGSSGQLTPILNYLNQLESFTGPVVISTVALESFYTAWEFFENQRGWELEIKQIQVNYMKTLNDNISIWAGQNPISILIATKFSNSSTIL